MLERYHYTLYGQLQVLDADFSDDADGVSDVENPLSYSGRRFDSESGLDYFRARNFHAQLGLFLRRDPLTSLGGPCLYRESSTSFI